MKLLAGMVAGAIGVAVAAGPAAAADYHWAAYYSGGNWVISWPIDPQPCFAEISDQIDAKPSIITVDGVDFSASTFTTYGNLITITFLGVPNGAHIAATVNGNDHMTCGADRLMLPAAMVAPTPVPTLSEWAMILLGVMLAGAAAMTIHRRRTA